MARKYVVSYTEFTDGLIQNAGCFDYAYDTHENASEEMVEDYESVRDAIREISKHPENFDAEVSEDEVDGKSLPVLCVIREWNGKDYNIFTWTVWPVNF